MVAPPDPVPAPPSTWASEMVDASDDWADQHDGERPSIQDAPYSQGSASDKQWLIDNGYCTA